MSNDDRLDARIIAAAARATTAEERYRLVRAACADDSRLIERVMAELEGVEDGRETEGERASSGPGHGGGAPMRSSTELLMEDVPEQIAGYRIVDSVGIGGSADVLLGESIGDGSVAAIKLLRRSLLGTDAVERLEQERELLRMLNHPAIVRVRDWGSLTDGRPYIVLDHSGGSPLNVYLQPRKLAASAKVHILTTLCGGLSHAHERGIVHRDLKPDNIIVSDNPQDPDLPSAQIIDFGTAKMVAGQAASCLTPARIFTEEGVAVGTRSHMSPEQATGSGKIDNRADIYSLGLIAADLLKDEMARDADLRTVILGCLHTRPEDRYETVRQFAGALRDWSRGRPAKRRRLRRFGIAAVAAGAMLAVGLGVTSKCRADRAYLDARKTELREGVIGLVREIELKTGTASVRREHLDRGFAMIAPLLAEYPCDVELRSMQADMRSFMAEIINANADYARAEVLRRQVMETRGSELGANPDDPEATRRYGFALIKLGDTIFAQGRAAEAGRLYEEAGSLHQSLFARTEDCRDLDELCWTQDRMIAVDRKMGREDRTDARIQLWLQLSRKQLEIRPDRAPAFRNAAAAEAVYASLLKAAGDLRGAEQAIGRSHQHAVMALSYAPNSRFYKISLCDSFRLLGQSALDNDQTEDAARMFNDAWILAREVHMADPEDRDAMRSYLDTAVALSTLNQQLGRHAEVRGVLHGVFELASRPAFHKFPDAINTLACAESMFLYARSLIELRRDADALDAARLGMALIDRMTRAPFGDPGDFATAGLQWVQGAPPLPPNLDRAERYYRAAPDRGFADRPAIRELATRLSEARELQRVSGR